MVRSYCIQVEPSAIVQEFARVSRQDISWNNVVPASPIVTIGKSDVQADLTSSSSEVVATICPDCRLAERPAISRSHMQFIVEYCCSWRTHRGRKVILVAERRWNVSPSGPTAHLPCCKTRPRSSAGVHTAVAISQEGPHIAACRIIEEFSSIPTPRKTASWFASAKRPSAVRPRPGSEPTCGRPGSWPRGLNCARWIHWHSPPAD